MNRLTAGTTAPDFELPDQNGVMTRLSTFQGKKKYWFIFIRKR